VARRYDAVIVGGGPNGLVAAAYLARAGRSVLVLERRPVVGGSAVTEELAPGFAAPLAFADAGTFDPGIVAELELAKHGLELLPPTGVLVPRADGPPLFLPPPSGGDPIRPAADAVAAESPADAEALVELDRFLRRFADALAPVLGAPLPALEPSGLGGYLELLRPGWRLRRLGERDLAEAMRFLPMPVADVVEERFESPALRAAVAAGGLTGSWLGPRSPGSALNLLLHRCGLTRGALGFPRYPRGGAGGLAEALSAAARAAGAEVVTGTEVSRILVEEGKVAGVELADDGEVHAPVVISCLDPKTTFLRLVEPSHLEPSLLRAVTNLRARGTVGVVHYALDRLPHFPGTPEGGGELAGRVLIGDTVDRLEQAFDDAKYGRVPERPLLDLTFPSIADPTLAPGEHHVLAAWVQYPPHRLREGSWEENRSKLGDAVDRLIEEHAPGFTGTVRHRRILTPADLEEHLGCTGGCLYHLEPALDQFLYLRPLPHWSRHTTPIHGLHLGGAGTHGGGGLTGLAGRNAARSVLG